MGFKAVAVAWSAIFNETENKFYPDALTFLQDCSSKKIKIVIFSTQKEIDPQVEIKKNLNAKNLKIDHLTWAQSNSDAEIKSEVLNQHDYDQTRTIGMLPEKEIFYAENRRVFFEALLEVQNKQRNRRAFFGALMVMGTVFLAAAVVISMYASGGTAAGLVISALEAITAKIALPVLIPIAAAVVIVSTLFAALVGVMTSPSYVKEVSEDKQPLLDNSDKVVKETLANNPTQERAPTASDKKRAAEIVGNDKIIESFVPLTEVVEKAASPTPSKRALK